MAEVEHMRGELEIAHRRMARAGKTSGSGQPDRDIKSAGLRA